jgi:hypothetical protein
MDETRSVKKIFEGKLEGRRGRGRPRLMWINDVEWTSIIRETKAKLKGP